METSNIETVKHSLIESGALSQSDTIIIETEQRGFEIVNLAATILIGPNNNSSLWFLGTTGKGEFAATCDPEKINPDERVRLKSNASETMIADLRSIRLAGQPPERFYPIMADIGSLELNNKGFIIVSGTGPKTDAYGDFSDALDVTYQWGDLLNLIAKKNLRFLHFVNPHEVNEDNKVVMLLPWPRHPGEVLMVFFMAPLCGKEVRMGSYGILSGCLNRILEKAFEINPDYREIIKAVEQRNDFPHRLKVNKKERLARVRDRLSAWIDREQERVLSPEQLLAQTGVPDIHLAQNLMKISALAKIEPQIAERPLVDILEDVGTSADYGPRAVRDLFVPANYRGPLLGSTTRPSISIRSPRSPLPSLEKSETLPILQLEAARRRKEDLPVDKEQKRMVEERDRLLDRTYAYLDLVNFGDPYVAANLLRLATPLLDNRQSVDIRRLANEIFVRIEESLPKRKADFVYYLKFDDGEEFLSPFISEDNINKEDIDPVLPRLFVEVPIEEIERIFDKTTGDVDLSEGRTVGWALHIIQQALPLLINKDSLEAARKRIESISAKNGPLLNEIQKKSTGMIKQLIEQRTDKLRNPIAKRKYNPPLTDENHFLTMDPSVTQLDQSLSKNIGVYPHLGVNRMSYRVNTALDTDDPFAFDKILIELNKVGDPFSFIFPVDENEDVTEERARYSREEKLAETDPEVLFPSKPVDRLRLALYRLVILDRFAEEGRDKLDQLYRRETAGLGDLARQRWRYRFVSLSRMTPDEISRHFTEEEQRFNVLSEIISYCCEWGNSQELPFADKVLANLFNNLSVELRNTVVARIFANLARLSSTSDVCLFSLLEETSAFRHEVLRYMENEAQNIHLLDEIMKIAEGDKKPDIEKRTTEVLVNLKLLKEGKFGSLKKEEVRGVQVLIDDLT
jgi:hypothetical protein